MSCSGVGAQHQRAVDTTVGRCQLFDRYAYAHASSVSALLAICGADVRAFRSLPLPVRARPSFREPAECTLSAPQTVSAGAQGHATDDHKPPIT